MIAKTLTYVDFNDVERIETFHFNLTEAELTQWQNSIEGGMREHVESIIAAKSEPELIKLFQDVIDRSYGRKSADGRRFEKSAEILADFKATQAYSDLYMELATDAEKAAAFINGLTPKNRRAMQSATPAAAIEVSAT